MKNSLVSLTKIVSLFLNRKTKDEVSRHEPAAVPSPSKPTDIYCCLGFGDWVLKSVVGLCISDHIWRYPKIIPSKVSKAPSKTAA